MNKLRLLDLPVNGKRVLVRADFNVPLNEKGEITDFLRIDESLPTIRFLTAHGAKTILVSHLGRPNGKVVESLRLTPIQKALEARLGKPIKKVNDCIGPEVTAAVNELKDGEVLLLENVRFHPEEEKNEEEFAKKLAELADFYVNDAFGTAHRPHASTCTIAKFTKKAAAGLLLEKEIAYLSKATSEPQHPFVAILGGAKVSDKITVIRNLMEKADTLIIGGAMAYTFLQAIGHKIGASKVEEDKLDLARDVFQEARRRKIQLLLPLDHVIAQEAKAEASSKITEGVDIPEGWKGLDIGPQSIKVFDEAIKNAALVLWNGPMGVFEIPKFRKGTFEIVRALASSSAVTIIGGGDSASAVHMSGLASKISHISTGGGASLEFLEGKELPGVAALNDKWPRKTRVPIIAGNWKMNNTIAASQKLVQGLLEKIEEIKEVETIVAPPFTALAKVKEMLRGSNIKLAAQNVHYEESGAYTGEISPSQLKEVGCDYVIIGHSERRVYYNETNHTVNKKIISTLKQGLLPIVCIGEDENQREKGLTREIIAEQFAGCFTGLTKEEMRKIVIAYEPIWAIGTGKTATPKQAQEVHKQIRDLISEKFGVEVAEVVRLQYGGSVKPENIAELINQPDIDGALVGGASLKADTFSDIVKASAEAFTK